MRWVKLTLPIPLRGAVAVDDLAVDLEQLGRDVAEARRRRDGEAALHVGGDRRAGAADRRARLRAALAGSPGCSVATGAAGAPVAFAGRPALGGDAGSPSRLAGSAGGAAAAPDACAGDRPGACARFVVDRRGRGRGSGGEGGVGRAVVGEELSPRLADRLRVLPELLVHLLDQPGVGAEPRTRRRRRAHVPRVPVSTTPGWAGTPAIRRPAGRAARGRR